jgi:uncharacterized protein (DUF2132 family)
VGLFHPTNHCWRPAAETTMTQAKDPLHGMTLESILVALQAHYGWDGLAERVDIRCFKSDPSIKSSLTFLRKTPWARAKVEQLFVQLCRSKA